LLHASCMQVVRYLEFEQIFCQDINSII